MADLGIMSEVICTCGRCVFEADLSFCADCGDVMCKDCHTDCFTCGKMYCINCSQSPTRCLKCDYKMAKPKTDEKAFLVLDGGVATPIKNSAFMIKKTSLMNARDITLELAGTKYKFCYRQMVQNEANSARFDYFLYFEKVSPSIDPELDRKIREVFNGLDDFDYDDYGNPWTGRW